MPTITTGRVKRPARRAAVSHAVEMVRATERLMNDKCPDGEDPSGHDLDPADAVDRRGTRGQHRRDPGETGLLNRPHRRHPSEVETLRGDQRTPCRHERG